MNEDIKIYELKILSDDNIDELNSLLINAVENGASMGFLTPMCMDKARKYWINLLDDGVYLFVAKVNGNFVGTVQLHQCLKENGRHRGEVARLMVHSDFRRRGIGRLLMDAVENKAKSLNLSLLLLDTRDGDVSNNLYKNLDYIEVGKVPNYALSIDGNLKTTVFYYKNI